MTTVKDFKNNAFLITILPKFKKIYKKFQKNSKKFKKDMFLSNLRKNFIKLINEENEFKNDLPIIYKSKN